MEAEVFVNACPSCGSHLYERWDADGYYFICSNVWWYLNMVKGCFWVGTMEDLFGEHPVARKG